MAAASPQTLVDLLTEIARTAANEAAAQPAALAALVDQTLAGAQDVAEMPAQALQRLRQLVTPPDWFSLLVFGLLKIADLDPRLTVGALAAQDGWSKAVTLTFTDGGGSARLALALTDPNTIHGVILTVNGTIDAALGGRPVGLRIASAGSGTWRIPVNGPISAPAAPAMTSKATVHVDLARRADPAPGLTLSIGSLRGEITLTSPGPQWTLSAGLGDPGGAAGIGVALTPAAILGPLAAIVDISAIAESYSPTVSAVKGRAPTLDLGHRGI